MSKLFDITIISPEKTMYEGKAFSLIAPCEYGYLGVLADHAPLIANVTSGKITVKKELDTPQIFDFKGKGFLEVLNNNVTILLTQAESNA
jgi:F-type H+-transporting ATPase subunit epsilon